MSVKKRRETFGSVEQTFPTRGWRHRCDYVDWVTRKRVKKWKSDKEISFDHKYVSLCVCVMCIEQHVQTPFGRSTLHLHDGWICPHPISHHTYSERFFLTQRILIRCNILLGKVKKVFDALDAQHWIDVEKYRFQAHRPVKTRQKYQIASHINVSILTASHSFKNVPKCLVCQTITKRDTQRERDRIWNEPRSCCWCWCFCCSVSSATRKPNYIGKTSIIHANT